MAFSDVKLPKINFGNLLKLLRSYDPSNLAGRPWPALGACLNDYSDRLLARIFHEGRASGCAGHRHTVLLAVPGMGTNRILITLTPFHKGPLNTDLLFIAAQPS